VESLQQVGFDVQETQRLVGRGPWGNLIVAGTARRTDWPQSLKRISQCHPHRYLRRAAQWQRRSPVAEGGGAWLRHPACHDV